MFKCSEKITRFTASNTSMFNALRKSPDLHLQIRQCLNALRKSSDLHMQIRQCLNALRKSPD